jgi:hypothetical protein
MELLQLVLQVGDSFDQTAGSHDRIPALVGHGSMCHPATQIDADAHGALLHIADLPRLGLADDGSIDVFGMAFGDKVADPDHHLFFVAEDGQDDLTVETTRQLYGSRRIHHRGDSAFHIGRATTVDTSIRHVGSERVMCPLRQVPFGYYVGVTFEEQRLAWTVPAETDYDVGSAGLDLLHHRTPTIRFGKVDHGTGGLRFKLTRPVHTGDANQPASELDQACPVEARRLTAVVCRQAQ